MPKVRNSSVHPIEFEVSPWQTKKRKYVEVQGNKADHPIGNEPSRKDISQAFSTSALEPQHASQDITPEQPLHTDYLGGEQRAIPNVDQPSGKSADDGFRLGIFSIVDDKPEVAVREAMERLLQQTQVSDSAAPNMETLQLPNKLGGTACLAWLPDGQMIGELHSLDGDRAVSIKGREVISERECTSDAEWKLLHVTLQQASSCQEVSFLVEKTGCDAAMLSAPLQLHGSEAGLLGESTLQSDPSIHLSFACEELLSDDAAERTLATRHPELCGQGAIVNLGAFTCSGSGLERLDQPRRAQNQLYDSDLDA